jgi:predicted RNA-binding protein with PIN domain
MVGVLGVILIDGDNVRGKMKFCLTKEELCDAVELWSYRAGLSGKVGLIFDHGSKHSAYVTNKNKLGIIFSGPKLTADDVIVRDVDYFVSHRKVDVTVITQDKELQKRCRKNSVKKIKHFNKKMKRNPELDKVQNKIKFISSTVFADLMMKIFFHNITSHHDTSHLNGADDLTRSTDVMTYSNLHPDPSYNEVDNADVIQMRNNLERETNLRESLETLKRSYRSRRQQNKRKLHTDNLKVKIEKIQLEIQKLMEGEASGTPSWTHVTFSTHTLLYHHRSFLDL